MIPRTHSISAGSMADVAFLLLVFFLLVTKIAEDTGIMAQLPSIDAPESGSVHPRNLVQVSIGGNGELMLNGEFAELADLTQEAYRFYSNSGVLEESIPDPNYPKRLSVQGDTAYTARAELVNAVLGVYRPLPIQAVIQLKSRNDSPYAWYVEVMDALEGGRRLAGNEMLTQQGMISWEELEKHARYRRQLMAVELVFPSRVVDVWE